MKPKIALYHGENYYLVFKTLKNFKKYLASKNIEYKELFGSQDLDPRVIFESIHSPSLFAKESVVIIRDLGDSRTMYPFVDHLVSFLENSDYSNSIYIFHNGKIAKNTKIYKIIDKIGEINEYDNPKFNEIVSVIKKSLSIDDDAAKKLAENVNNNLFLLRNEIKKLSVLDKKITVNDINEYCVRLNDANEFWTINTAFINYLIYKNNDVKVQIITEFEKYITNNIDNMHILYSLYYCVLNFIKMKILISKGKGFRECLSLGYYFVKENYLYADKISEDELYDINSKLLDYEYSVKNGEIDPIMGFRRFLLYI